jgi:hypothetical protein
MRTSFTLQRSYYLGCKIYTAAIEVSKLSHKPARRTLTCRPPINHTPDRCGRNPECPPFCVPKFKLFMSLKNSNTKRFNSGQRRRFYNRTLRQATSGLGIHDTFQKYHQSVIFNVMVCYVILSSFTYRHVFDLSVSSLREFYFMLYFVTRKPPLGAAWCY